MKRHSLLIFAMLLIVALSLPVLAKPPQQEAVTCPGFIESRLIAGQLGRVLPGASNNVRAVPVDGERLGQIPGGATFLVLEGPTCANNLAWWKVDYNGMTGWTAEGSGSEYWVEPAGEAPPVADTATPVPTITPTDIGAFACPGFLASRLVVGERARVLPGNANALRAAPVDGDRLGEIPGGAMFIVLEGPQCANNLAWWKVNYNGVEGWTAEGSRNEYWLEPMGPIPTATPTFTPTITLTPSVTPTPTITPTPEPGLPPLTVRNPEIEMFFNGGLPQNREVITGETLYRLRPLMALGPGRVQKGAWSPDGKTIALLTTIGVWLHNAEALDEQPGFIPNPDIPYDKLAFSPDSSLLVLVASGINEVMRTTHGEGRFHVWNLSNGVRLSLFDRFLPMQTLSMAFAPDGQTLYASNVNRQVVAINMQDGSGRLVKSDRAAAMAVSPDGELLATLIDSNTIVSLWNLRLNESQITYQSFGGMYEMAFDKDNGYLFVAGDGGGNRTPGVLRVWDLVNKRRAEVDPSAVGGSLSELAYNPERNLVASGGSRWVFLFDGGSHRLVKTLEFAGRVSDLSFSPDGSQLLVVHDHSSSVDRVFIHNLDDDTTQALSDYARDREHPFVFVNADSSLLGTLSYYDVNTIVRVWETDTRELRYELTHRIGPVREVGFSADNRQVMFEPVSQNRDPAAPLFWDMNSGEVLPSSNADFLLMPRSSDASIVEGQQVVYVRNQYRVSTVLPLPGEPNILAIQMGDRVEFWDKNTRQPLFNLYVPGRLVTVSPDGTLLLTNHESSLWVWGVSTEGEPEWLSPGYVPPTATPISSG